jgi:hypothetical protein
MILNREDADVLLGVAPIVKEAGAVATCFLSVTA